MKRGVSNSSDHGSLWELAGNDAGVESVGILLRGQRPEEVYEDRSMGLSSCLAGWRNRDSGLPPRVTRGRAD